MAARDWLPLPQQLLLEVTAGAVFHDGLGEPRAVREALAWYPHDEAVARRHNALEITRPVEATSRCFYSRPFRVLGSARFVEACLERVEDEWLRSLPLVGGIDQYVDSTDALESPETARRVGLSA